MELSYLSHILSAARELKKGALAISAAWIIAVRAREGNGLISDGVASEAEAFLKSEFSGER